MHVSFDDEVDLSLIRGRRVAIIGYGNQGQAHAQNLRDQGVAVVVGARSAGQAAGAAAAAGFMVHPLEAVAEHADLLMILLPDEHHGEVFARCLAPRLRPEHTLAFGHAFSVHFGQVRPPPENEVILVAPVGPGHLLRSRFLAGGGIPVLVATAQDPRGRARALAYSYAGALGGGRAGILPTTFREECETDLFGEQAVIVGGVSALIRTGFEVLVEAGYPEELAYFECAHQMKLLVDLIHERGLAGMREAISNTARYGDLTRGPRLIDPGVKARMREVLGEIQSGAFAREWLDEHLAGRPRLSALTAAARAHRIEVVGERLRRLTAGRGPAE